MLLHCKKKFPNIKLKLGTFLDKSYVDGVKFEYIVSTFAFHHLTEREKEEAIGIGICDDDYWGMGLGKEAFRMWIDFWFKKGETEIYCQTWSGNERMIKLAEKLGFFEVERRKNSVEVEGIKYDNMTYELKK